MLADGISRSQRDRTKYPIGHGGATVRGENRGLFPARAEIGEGILVAVVAEQRPELEFALAGPRVHRSGGTQENPNGDDRCEAVDRRNDLNAPQGNAVEVAQDPWCGEAERPDHDGADVVKGIQRQEDER